MNKKTAAQSDDLKPLGAGMNGVRIFKEDDDKIRELSSQVKVCGFGVNRMDLLRECVSKGLPLVMARWKPAIKAVDNSTPKEG